MSKSNEKSLFSRLIDRVWRNPKANVSAGIRKACDDMPPRQRLIAVTVLLCAFVLLAFVAFGHACYRIGAGHAHNQIEVEHINNMELPKYDENPCIKGYRDDVLNSLRDSDEFDPCEQPTDSAYDIAGMEIED